ncbi:MAG: SpoIIE family protein phosphatase [Bacteroidota bacterium]|nr:SpoIIE family protein phosphatase [Bacteroidota bacterium]
MRAFAKIGAILFLLPFFIKAQYTVKNHLNLFSKKNTPVSSIAQDEKGYVWLGSKDGLVRFDGKNIKLFNQQSGLPAQKITSIYCYKNNEIYLGTDKGRVFVLKNENSIDSLSFSSEAPDSKITGFYKKDDQLFVATYGNGIYLFEKGKQAFHLNTSTVLSDDVVYTMKLVEGKLWCGTDAGISIVDPLNVKAKAKIASSEQGLPDRIVRSISSYSDKKLLIGMQDSGVCFFDIPKNKFERVEFFSEWDKGAVINCRINSNSDLVLASEKQGLFIFRNGRLYADEFKSALKDISLNAMLIDGFNSIWLTSSIGVHQVIEKRFEFINAQKGLPDDKILSVISDKDRSIWAGTSHGIIRIDRNENNNYSFTEPKDFPKSTVSCAIMDENGVIYFGTYENGIVVASGNKIYHFNTKNSAIPNDNISNLILKNNKLYVSTLGGGVVICQVNENKLVLEKSYTEKEGLNNDYVYGALIIGNDLFAASDGGGIEKLENSKFTNISEKIGLKSSTIYSLIKDSRGNIWAVTNADGVVKIEGNKVTRYGAKNGLRDEQPTQIIEYNNVIYLLHSKGIDKIDSKTGQVSYYDVMEGDLEPSLNSVFISNDILYSATSNGVLVYRLNQVNSDTLKPTALINSFLINYKPFSMDSIHDLKHNQNNLSFEFGGVWTKNPDKLLFKYILKGHVDEWKTSMIPQTVNYNNLDAGDYTFIIQVKNDDDVWSHPAEFSFSIALPIWKRPWFWILIAVVLGASIYYFVKWRTKVLKEENFILERKVAERTREIEAQGEIIAAANRDLEQLSLVASRTDNVVLILKPNGDIEYVNEAFQKLNRITLKEMLDKKINIFTTSNNSRIKQYVEEAVTHKRSVKYESLNEKDETNKVWEASTLTPIFDENGGLKKIIIIDSDITESKSQQAIIEQKNKDITDSIEYARKIQTAILPSGTKIRKALPDSFVFYRTKDIVSGDFYWFTEKEDFCIIAAIDCTGHGVPGAFMSLIGYNILNRIVNEGKVNDPAQILKNLNQGVLDALHGNRDNSGSMDGMDAAICKVYFKENKIEYAGAMRPLWIIGKEGVREIKADKIPIGTKQDPERPSINYTTHTITSEEDEVFYIFTDGYVDQFGGIKSKKLGSAKFRDLLVKIHKEKFITQEELLWKEHEDWKMENEQVDDMCVIGFRKN